MLPDAESLRESLLVRGAIDSVADDRDRHAAETRLTGYLQRFSVDVVDMQDIAGPHHRHPGGEIDLIMPIEGDATFDGHPAGWCVYGPGTAHYPTVAQGRALVLYLLPEGQIEFTRGAPPKPAA